MQAFRVEAIIEKDGSLTIKALPFSKGEVVEVIILPRRPSAAPNAYPLHGTKVEYLEPFKLVSNEND